MDYDTRQRLSFNNISNLTWGALSSLTRACPTCRREKTELMALNVTTGVFKPPVSEVCEEYACLGLYVLEFVRTLCLSSDNNMTL